jgi:hypothetical protein
MECREFAVSGKCVARSGIASWANSGRAEMRYVMMERSTDRLGGCECGCDIAEALGVGYQDILVTSVVCL